MNDENPPDAGEPDSTGSPASASSSDDSPSSPGQKRRVARWRWWVHLLVIGGYPLLIGWAGAQRGGESPALSGGAQGVLIVCVVEVFVFGTIFVASWLASRATREDLLLRWRPGFWVVPLGIGYSIVIRIAAWVAMLAIELLLVLCGIVPQEDLQRFARDNEPHLENVVDVSALKNDPAYFWLTVTLVSFVVAGLREELWRSGFLAGMRALWPKWFSSRLGQIAAVAIGAVIFGLAHVSMGALAMVMTGILGFLLGIIMVLHRSIWPAVIAHGMFDAASFALLPLATD